MLRRHVSQLVLVVDVYVVELELSTLYVYGCLRPCPSRVGRARVNGSIRDPVAPQCFSFGARPREQPEGFSQRGVVEKVLARILSSARRGHPLVTLLMGGCERHSKAERPFSSPGQRAFSVLTFITQQAMLRGPACNTEPLNRRRRSIHSPVRYDRYVDARRGHETTRPRSPLGREQ